METEIKKRKHRKGGTDYAKEKLAKAEAKIKELEEQLELNKRVYNKNLNEKEDTIRNQGTKISDLSARLSVAQGNEEEWKRKYNEAIANVPFWRKWLHGL